MIKKIRTVGNSYLLTSHITISIAINTDQQGKKLGQPRDPIGSSCQYTETPIAVQLRLPSYWKFSVGCQYTESYSLLEVC